ncbi:MAG: hypothetical protein ACRBBR_09505 [Cellvibrionaceae bacterium]
MKLHLTDLDELVQRVRNIHPRSYLNEAIVAYRAGAYRAALITTWIAVCVDIIEKVRELSASGDGAAKVIEQRLDKINPSAPSEMISFEREILNIAADELELISIIEKSHLERLKEDRNICAHPTFSQDGNQFSPLAETALSFIVQASNYLLIHPPVKGKVVINKIYELINEPSFPNTDEKAFAVLSSENNLGRVRSSSVKNLVIILLKRLFRDDENLDKELFAKICSALGAISRLNPDIYKDVLATKLSQMLSEASDEQLKRVFPFLIRRKEEWSKIEKAVKVRLEGLIASMSAEELISYQAVPLCEKIQDIFAAVDSAITEFKDFEKAKIIATGPSVDFKESAIELFINSMSYDCSEFRGNKLILPLSDSLSTNDLSKILEGSVVNKGAHGYNQILPAGSIESFFVRLYESTNRSDRECSKAWIKFMESVTKKKLEFKTLLQSMIEDQLLQAPPEEPELKENIPF